MSGEQASVSYLNPTSSCEFDPHTGINRLKEPKYSAITLSDSNLQVFTRILMIFKIVQSLLKSGEKATKREIYYRDPSLFGNQSKSDKAIETVALIL